MWERWEETHYGHRLLTIRIYDIIGTIIDRLIVDARPIFLQFQDVIWFWRMTSFLILEWLDKMQIKLGFFLDYGVLSIEYRTDIVLNYNISWFQRDL